MATIPYSLECSRQSGFVMDPDKHERIGYVTELAFDDIEFEPEFTVAIPFRQAAAPAHLKADPAGPGSAAGLTTHVVGVLEKFEWKGGAGDPLALEFYVSQETAMAIKGRQAHRPLERENIKKLAWWVGDYDQETKTWFEQAYPGAGRVTGKVAGGEVPDLHVDLNSVRATEGIDVHVHRVSLGVDARENQQYALYFGRSSAQPVIKPWGLVA